MSQTSPLFADRYCLTMAQTFHDDGMNDLVSFEMFVRRLPHHRRYLVAAGLGTFLWWLKNLTFTGEDYEYLLAEGFSDDFCRWLLVKTAGKRGFFTGGISAVPEGTIVGPETPMLRVTAPRIEATLIESLLLSVINHQTMIASKASKIVKAAGDKPVWDFSLRRLHGPEAAIGVARASYIAGCAGTATMEAGKVLGIPTTGTMAHHFIMAFGPDHETDAFLKFLRHYPDTHSLLIDTYDYREGVHRAIDASVISGIPLKAVRIDSGDLLEGSRYVREALDGSGCGDTKILASSDLDEYEIAKLKDAPIDAYGVGTMLGTSADAPNLGGVYKLVEQHERLPQFIMKTAANKATDPGCHQVWRSAKFGFDQISLVDETGPAYSRPLMTPVVVSGQIEPSFLRETTDLKGSRWRCQNGLHYLPENGYELRRSEGLSDLKSTLSGAS